MNNKNKRGIISSCHENKQNNYNLVLVNMPNLIKGL